MIDPLKKAASALNEAAPPGERLIYANPVEEVALKNMGGRGAPAAGGVPSYKKGDVEAGPPRRYGDEMSENLGGQLGVIGNVYDAEKQYRPMFADLDRELMLKQAGVDPSKTLLQAYEEDFAPAMARQREASVRGDVDAIRRLGPELAEARRRADPLAASLRDDIKRQAADDLFAGQGLTETEQMDLEQRVLEGAADRGMEAQASTLSDAIGQRLSANRQIGQQRLANASAASRLDDSDVLFGLINQRQSAPGQAMAQFGGSGMFLGSSPRLFNPESAYGGALATQNSQAEMDARTATAANRSAIFSGVMSGLGSVGQGLASRG